MPNQMREVAIDFFTGEAARGARWDVGMLLWELAENAHGPLWEHGNYSYELRELARHRQVVRGVLAKIRTDEIPHVGEPGGVERELDLAETEGLIEKNYFHFHLKHNLLVYQRNGHGSRSGRLAEYLTQQAGETLTLNPILQPEPTERLMRDGVEPLAMELSFSRPTNPDMYPPDDWGRRMVELANEAGGSRVAVRISSDRRCAEHERRRLTDRVRRSLGGWVEADLASVARMQVVENGLEHPIDLIADRLQSKQEIEMYGRYPIPESIHGALGNAYADEREALDAILGQPGRRLR